MTWPVIDWTWPSRRYQVGTEEQGGEPQRPGLLQVGDGPAHLLAGDGDVEVACPRQSQCPRQVDRHQDLAGDRVASRASHPPRGREVSAARGVADGADTADCVGRERREEASSGNGSGRVASPGAVSERVSLRHRDAAQARCFAIRTCQRWPARCPSGCKRRWPGKWASSRSSSGYSRPFADPPRSWPGRLDIRCRMSVPPGGPGPPPPHLREWPAQSFNK